MIPVYANTNYKGSGPPASTATTYYVTSAQQVPVSVGQTVSFGGWMYRVSGSHSYDRWGLAVYGVNGNAYLQPPDNYTLGTWIYQTASYTIPSWTQCPCTVMLYVQFITAPGDVDDARFDDGSISFGASAGGSPLLYVEDMLGTSRVITQSNGAVCYDADFDPYGGEHAYTDTCSSNVYKFEGKERDTETGNDDFGARYYSNRFGRWLSADWSAVPVPVPYANLTNPQTLNLYAMVSDDPESFADLDGHDGVIDTILRLAGGSLSNPGPAMKNLIVGGAKGLVNLTVSAGNEVNSALGVNVDGGGVSQTPELPLNNEGEVIGAQASTTLLFSMIGGVMGEAAGSGAAQGQITRYMGPGEAATASESGEIPNTNAKGVFRPTHVTTDAPTDSASAAQKTYELDTTPTHRATVPADRVKRLGPAPDGKPTTSGGGNQAATPHPIPVKPEEIKPLQP